jgi:hypothetical protein
MKPTVIEKKIKELEKRIEVLEQKSNQPVNIINQPPYQAPYSTCSVCGKIFSINHNCYNPNT